MKYLHLLLLCLSFSFIPQRSNAQILEIIKGGIIVYEGIKIISEIYDLLTEEEKSAIVFTTQSPSNIDIYLNGEFAGTINRNRGITCTIAVGEVNVAAVHANGVVFQDRIRSVSGVQQNVTVGDRQLDFTHVRGNNNGYISGNTVNFRSSPVIGDNKLGKLRKGDPVNILDVRLLPAKPSDRITLRQTHFIPANGADEFKISTGIAVTLLERTGNGQVKIRCTMNNRSEQIGYVAERDLGPLSNKWVKVNYYGTVGWVYGDYVRNR